MFISTEWWDMVRIVEVQSPTLEREEWETHHSSWSLEILKPYWADDVWTTYLEGREYYLMRLLSCSHREVPFSIVLTGFLPPSSESFPSPCIILHVLHICSGLWRICFLHILSLLPACRMMSAQRSFWQWMLTFIGCFLCDRNYTKWLHAFSPHNGLLKWHYNYSCFNCPVFHIWSLMEFGFKPCFDTIL